MRLLRAQSEEMLNFSEDCDEKKVNKLLTIFCLQIYKYKISRNCSSVCRFHSNKNFKWKILWTETRKWFRSLFSVPFRWIISYIWFLYRLVCHNLNFARLLRFLRFHFILKFQINSHSLCWSIRVLFRIWIPVEVLLVVICSMKPASFENANFRKGGGLKCHKYCSFWMDQCQNKSRFDVFHRIMLNRLKFPFSETFTNSTKCFLLL